MTDLAVVNRQETFAQLQQALSQRGIDLHHLEVGGQTVPLDADGLEAYDVGYVFPRRLAAGGVASALYNIPWVNGRSAVLTSRNKAGVLATLEQAGLPVPRSVYVANPVDSSELQAVFERFEPPVVVKPNSTTRGNGIVRVDDLDSFLGVCDYLGLLHENPVTADRSFLVQEYCPATADYRVMTLDGAYAGAVRREATDPGRWKHNVHRGAEATGVSIDQQARELAESVAEVLEIPLLGVDLLETEAGLVVIETNARPTIDDPDKYEPDFMDRLASLIERTAAPDVSSA